MRRLIVLSAPLYSAVPALAHELPGPHAHPHGDWSGTIALLLAAGVVLALAMIPGRSARRSMERDHDPR